MAGIATVYLAYVLKGERVVFDSVLMSLLSGSNECMTIDASGKDS